MPDSLARLVLDDAASTARKYRTFAERALEQVDDAAFFHAPDPESNSLAVIVKHVGGNLRSRWTDVLTTDGEKPDRDRDGEFVVAGEDRAAVMRRWEEGWSALDASLASVSPDDLLRTVTIRGEEMSLLQALNRSVTHVASHVGQIVYVAKHLRGTEWRTLSIPRGRSAEYLRAAPK